MLTQLSLKEALLQIHKESSGQEFTLDSLCVQLREMGVMFMPDSPKRMLSKLRRAGQLNYEAKRGVWRWL